MDCLVSADVVEKDWINFEITLLPTPPRMEAHFLSQFATFPKKCQVSIDVVRRED